MNRLRTFGGLSIRHASLRFAECTLSLKFFAKCPPKKSGHSTVQFQSQGVNTRLWSIAEDHAPTTIPQLCFGKFLDNSSVCAIGEVPGGVSFLQCQNRSPNRSDYQHPCCVQ